MVFEVKQEIVNEEEEYEIKAKLLPVPEKMELKKKPKMLKTKVFLRIGRGEKGLIVKVTKAKITSPIIFDSRKYGWSDPRRRQQLPTTWCELELEVSENAFSMSNLVNKVQLMSKGVAGVEK